MTTARKPARGAKPRRKQVLAELTEQLQREGVLSPPATKEVLVAKAKKRARKKPIKSLHWRRRRCANAKDKLWGAYISLYGLAFREIVAAQCLTAKKQPDVIAEQAHALAMASAKKVLQVQKDLLGSNGCRPIHIGY